MCNLRHVRSSTSVDAHTQVCGDIILPQCVNHTEYDALSRMGIDDPKGFVEKRYGESDTKVTLLVTCAVGEAVVTEVEAAVEEAQSSGSWIDIMVSIYYGLCNIFVHKIIVCPLHWTYIISIVTVL